MGLLRFCPDTHGAYIARCEPDHLTLPALGPHFRERFGQTPWAIIDEKRRLGIGCSGAELAFFITGEGPASLENQPDSEWENLWRHYHKTINNESRNNPDLQRRFMPQRYWKYLTEL
jgi:probable DNA metabolism protein